jgi:hypothetical protein
MNAISAILSAKNEPTRTPNQAMQQTAGHVGFQGFVAHSAPAAAELGRKAVEECMSEPTDEVERNELANRGVDYVTSAAKAVLGMVPFAGSLLAELAGTVVPNQRIDRIVKFAEVLDERLAGLEQDFVRSQVTNENFTDLVEEGLRQAARSVSEERREYIASLIANSLKSEDIEYVESKHLLRILGELNDIEVVWLRFYLDPVMNSDPEYRERHKEVLAPVVAYMGGPPQLIDKSALQKSYKDHMAELGLLDRRYELESSSFGTKLKPKGYDLSSLGRLLLREIDLAPHRDA